MSHKKDARLKWVKGYVKMITPFLAEDPQTDTLTNSVDPHQMKKCLHCLLIFGINSYFKHRQKMDEIHEIHVLFEHGYDLTILKMSPNLDPVCLPL